MGSAKSASRWRGRVQPVFRTGQFYVRAGGGLLRTYVLLVKVQKASAVLLHFEGNLRLKNEVSGVRGGS